MTTLPFNFGQIVHNSATTNGEVVVFVHGQSPYMSDFWKMDNNTILNVVKSAGLSSALVNLDPHGSLKSNGQTLTIQLQYIVNLFKVPKVTLICHGKGCIDAEASIYYNNADVYIDKVFAIAAPFYGTPVYTILHDSTVSLRMPGLTKNSATYDLQTTEMQTFRHAYDNSAKKVPFFTIGGTGSQNNESIYNGTVKLFLNALGSNDDVFLVNGTNRPGCVNIGLFPFYHNQLAQASVFWDLIHPFISDKQYSLKFPITPSTYNVNISSTQIKTALKKAEDDIVHGKSTIHVYIFFCLLIILLIFIIRKFKVFFSLHR